MYGSHSRSGSIFAGSDVSIDSLKIEQYSVVHMIGMFKAVASAVTNNVLPVGIPMETPTSRFQQGVAGQGTADGIKTTEEVHCCIDKIERQNIYKNHTTDMKTSKALRTTDMGPFTTAACTCYDQPSLVPYQRWVIDNAGRRGRAVVSLRTDMAAARELQFIECQVRLSAATATAALISSIKDKPQLLAEAPTRRLDVAGLPRRINSANEGNKGHARIGAIGCFNGSVPLLLLSLGHLRIRLHFALNCFGISSQSTPWWRVRGPFVKPEVDRRSWASYGTRLHCYSARSW
jgi:hypothetical protein